MMSTSLLSISRRAAFAVACSISIPVPRAHTIASRTPSVHARSISARTFVIQSVNGESLPFTDHLRTSPGYEHRARLDRALLRLDSKERFELSLRYAYRHAETTARPEFGPAVDDYLRGRWSLQGTTLTLVLDKRKHGRQPAPIVGTLSRGKVVLPVDVGNGFVRRHYEFVAQYDPSYF